MKRYLNKTKVQLAMVFPGFYFFTESQVSFVIKFFACDVLKVNCYHIGSL